MDSRIKFCKSISALPCCQNFIWLVNILARINFVGMRIFGNACRRRKKIKIVSFNGIQARIFFPHLETLLQSGTPHPPILLGSLNLVGVPPPAPRKSAYSQAFAIAHSLLAASYCGGGRGESLVGWGKGKICFSP